MNADITLYQVCRMVRGRSDSNLRSVISRGASAWNAWVTIHQSSVAQLYPGSAPLDAWNKFPRLLEQAPLNVTGVALVVCLLCTLTFLITSLKSGIAISGKDNGKHPVPIPYWIPYLGNLIPFFWDPADFCSWTTDVYGFSTPVRVRLGPVKLYLVAGADHLAALFRASKYMSTKAGVLVALENIFGTPSEVIPFYAADDSGVNPIPSPRSQVKPEHRLNFFQVRAAHKHLSGNGLVRMTEHLLGVLGQRIEDSQIGDVDRDARSLYLVPAIGWLIIEFCRDAALLSRARAEVDAARMPQLEGGKPKFDIGKLCSSPLLQSVYAETLRLRVALIVTRTPEREDFTLMTGCSQREKLSSRSAAMNPAIWNVGTPGDPHPLGQFWADRFLVYPDDPSSGPARKELPGCRKLEREPDVEPQRAKEPHFSMDSVAGGWISCGGGERICPGRHFAKQEIIGSFAILSTHYDIDLLTPVDWVPKPNMDYFPFGGLPPIGKIPFRIRRRKI